jgi:ABC-type dipeptide/oligopeptide/nickel transport system ATPase component
MERNEERPLLSIEELVTTFHMRGGEGNAVDGVNLTIRRGETVGLVGESGCGKSMTAMSVMAFCRRWPGSPPGGSTLPARTWRTFPATGCAKSPATGSP